MDLLYEYTKRQQEARSAGIAKKDKQIEDLTQRLNQAVTLLEKVSQQPPSDASAEVAVQGDHAQIDNRRIHNEVKVRNEVTVNVFGQERVDHITASQIYRLLMEAKGSADPAIQALLDTALVVFSDPSKPENITCYLPNKKTSDALVHEPTGWQIKPIETVLSPMVRKSLDVLFLKQPFGHEDGLPNKPDILACGEVLKEVMKLETDPVLSKKASAPHGPLRTVLVRNKGALAKACGGTPPTVGEE